MVNHARLFQVIIGSKYIYWGLLQPCTNVGPIWTKNKTYKATIHESQSLLQAHNPLFLTLVQLLFSMLLESVLCLYTTYNCSSWISILVLYFPLVSHARGHETTITKNSIQYKLNQQGAKPNHRSSTTISTPNTITTNIPQEVTN